MPQIPAPADPRRIAKLQAFDRLLTIMDELRLNCPWDKKQTLESLRHLTIEETYELSDAILEGDLDEVRKELGDLMLHMAFYSRIGQEKGAFDIADVLNGVCEKLINRHPHIYGDVEANDEEAVKANWEKIKLQEKGSSDEFKSVLAGVPQSLPALVKAMRMQEKARGVGFDWEQPEQVWEKVEEELEEFHQEAEAYRQQPGDAQARKLQGEFGDVLFSLINYARFLKLNPEEALERTNKKFLKRFQHLEKQAHANGKELSNMTLAEMDVYWEEAKGLE
jgi:XTP/dITP diphosphohydrolase